ncbi:MAG: LytTR family DNA-binding domain-containing protein [Longicatena sp.]
MYIAICDDSKIERDTLLTYIDSYSCAELLDYVVEEFENAESLLTMVKKEILHPDILFMDIYMDGMTGMDAVKLLKAEGFSGAVIFTTTSEIHAVESYKIMADGYLVKPYTKEDFHQTFKRAISSYTEHFKSISFLSDRLEYRVFLKDLEFIEVATRGCILHVKGKTITTTKSLANFDEELKTEGCFLRCHRGCIVNMNYVARIEDDYILMKDGAKAQLTIKNKPSIKKAMSDYFFLKMRGN